MTPKCFFFNTTSYYTSCVANRFIYYCNYTVAFIDCSSRKKNFYKSTESIKRRSMSAQYVVFVLRMPLRAAQ